MATYLDKIFLDHRTRPPETPRYDLLERIEVLLPVVRTFSDARVLLVTLIRKADILLTMGENEQAIQFLAQTEAEVGDSLQHKLAPRVRLLLAKAYAGRQAWEQVTEHCEAGIQLVERSRAKINLPYLYSAYLRERIDLYALGVRATYERYKQSVNPDYGSMLRFAELSKSQFALRYGQTNLPATGGWQQLRHTFLQTCAEIDALQADSEQQQARLNTLLKTRRRCSEELFFALTDAPRPEFNLPDVQNALDPDEAILYYYWLDAATLLTVTLDRERVVPELRTIPAQQREKIETTASVLLSAKTPRLAGLETRVGELSWLLPQESAAIACLQSKQRLLISAHRALHAIPFHALSWKNEYLIQRFAVSYIPNLTSLQLRYVPLQTQNILILGIEDYAFPGEVKHPLPTLPNAELEAQDIEAEYARNKIPVTLLRGAEANEHCLRDLMEKEELSRYHCLHIALHGNNIEGDSPLESYLCLYNSRLKGPEIAFWQLNAECVFLSACCSGQRAITGRFLKELPGDELLGLQAVFFLTGAKRILGALWPVHDRAGRDIAVAFHRHYARGARAECALQQAIREYLAAKASSARMAHWASLFLSVLGRTKTDNV